MTTVKKIQEIFARPLFEEERSPGESAYDLQKALLLLAERVDRILKEFPENFDIHKDLS
jgi:hypothetical protein